MSEQVKKNSKNWGEIVGESAGSGAREGRIGATG